MFHQNSHNSSMTITIEPAAHDIYMRSIARRPPEEYAVLAGFLDDPFHVTDLRPIPPMVDGQGRANAGHAHVQLNADYVGHYLNRELVPFGKYLLGILHTHPLGITHLSGGRAGGGDGDIPSMRGTLERAVKSEPRWQNFLAPIGMYDAEKGKDHLIGYVIRLDQAEPISATIKVASKVVQPAPVVAIPSKYDDLDRSTDELIAHSWRYQERINGILADRESPPEHREWMAQFLHETRRHDLQARREELFRFIDRLA
jgi:hypothetical protein